MYFFLLCIQKYNNLIIYLFFNKQPKIKYKYYLVPQSNKIYCSKQSQMHCFGDKIRTSDSLPLCVQIHYMKS